MPTFEITRDGGSILSASHLQKCHFSRVISASTSHHQIQTRSIDRDEIVLQLMLETINGKPTMWPVDKPVQRLCIRKTNMQLENVLNVHALMCSKQWQIFLLKPYTILKCAAVCRNNRKPWSQWLFSSVTGRVQVGYSRCLHIKGLTSTVQIFNV